MAEKLRECPFCGGEVELDFVGEEFYMVRCDKCASATSFAKEYEDGTAGDSTKAETVEAWNRRVDNSLIAELPCRVGDTVYVCYESPKGISETTIARFEIYGKFTTVVFSNGSQFTVWKNDWSVYKSAVFLTREEAERALKSLEERE